MNEETGNAYHDLIFELDKITEVVNDLVNWVYRLEGDVYQKPSYIGLQKQIKELREELDGLRIHYSSTLKEIKERTGKPKEKPKGVIEIDD